MHSRRNNTAYNDNGKRNPHVVATEIPIVIHYSRYEYKEAELVVSRLSFETPLRGFNNTSSTSNTGRRSARTKNPFIAPASCMPASLGTRVCVLGTPLIIAQPLFILCHSPSSSTRFFFLVRPHAFREETTILQNYSSSSAHETASYKKECSRLETLVVRGCLTLRHVLFSFPAQFPNAISCATRTSESGFTALHGHGIRPLHVN